MPLKDELYPNYPKLSRCYLIPPQYNREVKERFVHSMDFHRRHPRVKLKLQDPEPYEGYGVKELCIDGHIRDVNPAREEFYHWWAIEKRVRLLSITKS